MDEAAVEIILHEYFGLFFIDDDEETSCIFFLVNLYGKVLKWALHMIEFPCCCSLLDRNTLYPKVWVSVTNPKVL